MKNFTLALSLLLTGLSAHANASTAKPLRVTCEYNHRTYFIDEHEEIDFIWRSGTRTVGVMGNPVFTLSSLRANVITTGVTPQASITDDEYVRFQITAKHRQDPYEGQIKGTLFLNTMNPANSKILLQREYGLRVSGHFDRMHTSAPEQLDADCRVRDQVPH